MTLASYIQMFFDRTLHHRATTAGAAGAAWLCATALMVTTCPNEARAGFTPESPEVQALVARGLHSMETHPDIRLGGKCLQGLAFFKAGKPTHPRVGEAVDECLKVMRANPVENELDVYSNGLAVIFLCEVSPQKYAREIEYYLGRLKARQKPHGGWGYFGMQTGDTSQTQYGALAYWEAHQHGFHIDGTSLENLADWLMRTQDPTGGWGYQGKLPTSNELTAQSEMSCSLSAAGLGSAYICADLFGFRTSATTSEENNPTIAVPAVLRPVQENGLPGDPKKIHAQHTTASRLFRTIGGAHDWMDKHYTIDIGPKCYYYLYGLERYKSFQESFDASDDNSPPWYNDGYAFLAKQQASDGTWAGYCGPEIDTAFATLFLLRSTQKSMRARLGEGMLLAGRGLPKNLSRAKLHNGQLIVEQVHTRVDELLSLIDDRNEGVLDDLARDPTQLVVDRVDEKSARRLQQLVRGGEPDVRLLAVRALGRSGNLDYVPTLLYALTDPDRRVVLEARNELRFISRTFDSIGPPDDFTEQQRFAAIDAWKKWYKSIRPAAMFEK